MKYIWTIAISIIIFSKAHSQQNPIDVGDIDGNNNAIPIAVPFLTFGTDSRATGMGDIGVATSPDINSTHWNNAKYAFIEDNIGFSLSYSPWLKKLTDDMVVNYVSAFKKIAPNQTVAMSMKYFDLGEINLTDNNGQSLGVENPREAAVDVTYARSLAQNFSLGISFRYIWSNIAGHSTGATDVGAGKSFAADVGAYYRKPLKLKGLDSEISFGLHLSNIGQKITYTSQENEDFLPANFRIGTAWRIELDPYNSITVAIDVNKLMVPTPPIIDEETGEIIKGEDPDKPLLSGTFGSFTDAPGGFSEELKEFICSFGTEYWYRDLFSVRGGYFQESKNKGDRKYFSAGLGLRYQVFGLDISYLIPKEQNHPLGQTLRLSLLFNLN